MQHRGIVFSIVIALLAITSQSQAESGKFCHALFEEEWLSSGKALGLGKCKQGDTLIARITRDVAAAGVVGQYCDLRFSIFSEPRPGTNDISVVCTFIEGRQSR
jgi:hypothetical protein